MNKWKIRLGELGKDSSIELNGEDISDTVYSITIEGWADDLTIVTVVYADNKVGIEADERQPVLLRDANFVELSRALTQINLENDQ